MDRSPTAGDDAHPAADRRVLVIHTGGTLGMRRSPQGYAPEPGYLDRVLADRRALNHPDLPAVDIVELPQLKDSSDMRPADWQRLADLVVEHQDRADGFVILHGTDTMAYSAAALAFLLEDLDRPVVFTGSQIPMAEARSDAQGNLITAIQLAADGPFAEVGIYMNGRLLRGTRATKVSASGFDAFESPNAAPLAEVGVTVRFAPGLVRPERRGRIRAARLEDVPVVALRLFPGFAAATLRAVLAAPVRGLVLEAFGAGNLPDDGALRRELARATERGVVVVATTQCLRGRVDLGAYRAGSSLASAGVVPGHDMTAEAALTKLAWLLSLALEPDEVRRRIGRNVRGELTPPTGAIVEA